MLIMYDQKKIIMLNEKIKKIKELFNELEIDSGSFPALNRNTKRALASLKMIELNISDLIEFDLI
jgi:hypothetical protein